MINITVPKPITVGEAEGYLMGHGFIRHLSAHRYTHSGAQVAVDVVDAEASCFTVTAFTRDRARLIVWQAHLSGVPRHVFTATIAAATA